MAFVARFPTLVAASKILPAIPLTFFCTVLKLSTSPAFKPVIIALPAGISNLRS